MLKNAKLRRTLTVIAVILFVIIAGGIIFMRMKHYVSIRKQHLNSYTYSSGGSMTGGFYRESVKRADGGTALVSISEAEWHSQDPTVREYKVDDALLDELEKVIRSEKMNFWNGKKFTNMFVADGASYSYSFSFDKASIGFSSQIYPGSYRTKLAKLAEVIKRYLADATPLPGLVNERQGDENNVQLPEDKLELYVYSYCGNYLEVRILNGTGESVAIDSNMKLVDAETGRLIAETGGYFPRMVSAKSRDELSFFVEERLEAGQYTLTLGEREIPFEIR